MKTARERAGEILNTLGIALHNTRLDQVERIVKEAMRDQRHACAEAVNDAGGQHATVDRVHAAVMNTSFPGEGQ